ncbi:MAG TPA: matrixin family metalloprotease [Thermoanaerobaculia bacterium]|nr:matrixin family metalloprotease [Thermoanaerobaculia bacterium]
MAPLLAGPAAAALLPLADHQMVREAKHIVVASVVSAGTRWNENHNLILTDYTLAVEDQLLGGAAARLRITVAGGTLDGETHDTSLSTHLEVGHRYLLFLHDPDEPGFSPMVGGWQGVFREVRTSAGPGRVAAGSHAEAMRVDGQEVEFAAFVEAVRAWIPRVLAAPAPAEPRAAAGRRHPPAKRYDPALAATGGASLAPLSAASDAPDGPLLERDETWSTAVERSTAADPDSTVDAYRYSRAAKRPIVFNQLPNGFSFAPHDQYMMSSWNVYAAKLFRVMAKPTNTWAWRDGRFDIAGFPPNSQMQKQFGRSWKANELGVTFFRWTSGPIIESDVALNPAFSWTTDERTATGSGNSQSFRQTILHELGHAWGLSHPFDYQNVWWDSVMNYPPRAYRLATLFADDAEAVRRAYSGTKIYDAAISAYRTRDAAASNHASYESATPTPSTVAAGSTLVLSSAIKLENTGNTSILNPSVEIYLVPQRFSWNGSHYLQTARFTTTLDSFSTVFLSLGTIRVPTTVPAGTYFLGYFFRDTKDANGSNNSAWSEWNNVVRVTR